KAELYPQFSLTGEINLNSEDFGNLFSSGSSAGFVAPGFRWNILNYGRLRRNVQIQELEFQNKIVEYENAVLNAHREVEDAMIQFLESRNRTEKLAESASAAARSVELVSTQYREGKVSFSQVFVLQGALVGSQDELVSAQADVATALVRTYRALGGGWQLRLSVPYRCNFPLEAINTQTSSLEFLGPAPELDLTAEPLQDVDESVLETQPEDRPDFSDRAVGEMEAEIQELLREREKADQNRRGDNE
ncbi:MAG: TolC family protein, partial [Planctomycetota bacterium]